MLWGHRTTTSRSWGILVPSVFRQADTRRLFQQTPRQIARATRTTMLDWPEMDRPVPLNNRRFNTLAACDYAAFLLFAIVGCWQADIDLPYAGTGVLLRCICLAIFLSLPVYWHVKHRPDRREAALAPFWLLAFSFTLPAIVNLCGRSEMPLQDLNLIRLDSMLGINVPAIAAWADQHRLGHLINDTYPMLIYYLIPLAVLAPALFGRWIAAR